MFYVALIKTILLKLIKVYLYQIWKTQQLPQDWKWSVFIPVPKKGNAKDIQTTTQSHSSHMLVK